jgi:L-ascorbate metabolism protein UlaG (beta-lactamase superfamily)
MKIKFLGHSCFLITSGDGNKVITDPYVTGIPWPPLRYGEIRESADVVTVSHNHKDHSNAEAVRGNPQVLKGKTQVVIKGMRFRSVTTYHDRVGGKKKGENIIFICEIDGVTICHLGDLGHQLAAEQVAGLGRVDVLLVPVGGFYTIEPDEATGLCDRLKPRVIIPMHYKTDKLNDDNLGDVETFLKGKRNVSRLEASEVEFTHGNLPAETQIIVLKPAM